MNKLTDIKYIKRLGEKYGFAILKGLGQNFIVNEGICPKIVTASGINSSTNVLEIGAGIGVLTKELATVAKKVVSIEVDRAFIPLLCDTLQQFENLKIIEGDVLKLNLNEITKAEFCGEEFSVVANLPYYITSPVIMQLLESELPIITITVMVQKEAAKRICAAVGSRESGAVTVATAFYSEPKLLFDVSPGSFYPPPKVTSSVIKLTKRKTPPVSADKILFRRVVKAAFSQRRKTAVNAISAGLVLPKETVLKAVLDATNDANIRPEALSLQQLSNITCSLFIV